MTTFLGTLPTAVCILALIPVPPPNRLHVRQAMRVQHETSREFCIAVIYIVFRQSQHLAYACSGPGPPPKMGALCNRDGIGVTGVGSSHTDDHQSMVVHTETAVKQSQFAEICAGMPSKLQVLKLISAPANKLIKRQPQHTAPLCSPVVCK
eukprot:GHUV01033629.1.p1 GENE.GHUV01033629.1~~GHUV01033629.1.p1  ORF type:complete len:151 (-),score=12.75 GHUV01033629.1:286-738(-)